MFSDLVGSTALSARLDPEELREVVRAYQAACAEAIAQFEGHVAQYLGDGLLVYFGYPQAHEDDAQRAVRSGLGIIESVGTLGARIQQRYGVRLAVRVGIHTGLVVVGEVGGGAKHEQLALGETPNLAARLQALAEPNTMVVSGDTHRLVRGLFLVHDLGSQALKGAPSPVQVCQVLGASGALGRMDVAATAGLTQLVGREQEVGLLLDRWARVTEGHGQVVLLSGEAGIGKSRLVQVVKDRVANAPHTPLECRCSPYYEHTPLYPVTDLLPRVFEWSRDDGPDAKLHKLEKHLTRYRLAPVEAVPLLASLLSLPAPDRYPLPPMSPERQKRKTLEAVLALLLAIAAEHPVLLIAEDLHWVDPSTLELLTLLLDQVPTAQLFALFTTRPSFQAPWTARSHLAVLTLNRFTSKQTELMVEHVAGGKTLPPEVFQQIVSKTDGVPLFIEELTKMVLESGLLRAVDDHYALTGPLPPLAIPSTLQDSLMARLDRLATVKEMAQLGATLGRTFPYELLRAVSPLDEATLQRELGRLVESELLYQRGVPPQATYTFKHALIQEAAYQSLLKSTRQQYHQRVAQVLIERFPEIAETQPELLAHHCAGAGLNKEAVSYWKKAGERALERSANLEAVSHLTRGVELLAILPDTPERVRLELPLQVTLGASLMAAKGYGAPEVEQPYTRALALCRQVGDNPELFPALIGLWRFYTARAKHRTAYEVAQPLLTTAQRLGDRALLLEAHRPLGNSLLFLGEFSAARLHLEQVIALYDPLRHRSHAVRYGHDARVVCGCHCAQVLWFLGYPDQALKCMLEALSLGQELSHPPSLGIALVLASMVHQYRGEERLAQERAEAVIAMASEKGLPFYSAMGTVMQGWGLAAQGRGEEGIPLLHRGLAACRATGAEVFRPYFLALLAEEHRRGGRIEEGLTVLSEALAAAHASDERLYDAELSRLKGELLLRDAATSPGSARPSAEQEAERCFREAIDIARRQRAKSVELRATMSLARLWQAQGRRADARNVLGEVYGWFTEGFDTLDLKEAKALLDTLA